MAYSFLNATYDGSGSGVTGFVVSSGQNLIVLAQDIGTSGTTLTVGDGGTNTYTKRGTQIEVRDGTVTSLFDCLSPIPGTYTISIGGSPVTPLIVVYRYTGLVSYSAGSFASHDYNTGTPPTTTDGLTTTAITPTSYPAVIIGTIGYAFGANTLYSAGTGFNRRSGLNTSPCEVLEDLELSSGSNVASFTMATGGASVVIMGAAYLESGVTPPPTVPSRGPMPKLIYTLP